MLDRVSQFALVAAAEAIADRGRACRARRSRRDRRLRRHRHGRRPDHRRRLLRLYEERSDRVKPYQRADGDEQCGGGVDRHRPRRWARTSPIPPHARRRPSRSARRAKRIAAGEVDVMIAGGSRGAAHLRHAEGMGGAEDAGDRGSGRSIGVVQAVREGSQRAGAGRGRGDGRARNVGARPRVAARTFSRELAGYGLSTDASTSPGRPWRARRARCGLRSMTRAHVRRRLGYINAHGTATLANDAGGDRGDQGGLRRRAQRSCRSARPSRCTGICSVRPARSSSWRRSSRCERRVLPPTMHLRHARSGVRSRLRGRVCAPVASADRGHVQFVRLWRHQRLAGLPRSGVTRMKPGKPFFLALAQAGLLWTCAASAEPIVVQHTEGVVHGFLSLSSPEGSLLADGDLIQTRGGRSRHQPSRVPLQGRIFAG